MTSASRCSRHIDGGMCFKAGLLMEKKRSMV